MIVSLQAYITHELLAADSSKQRTPTSENIDLLMKRIESGENIYDVTGIKRDKKFKLRYLAFETREKGEERGKQFSAEFEEFGKIYVPPYLVLSRKQLTKQADVTPSLRNILEKEAEQFYKYNDNWIKPVDAKVFILQEGQY